MKSKIATPVFFKFKKKEIFPKDTFFLLTGLENLSPYLSRDHGRDLRYWRGKSLPFYRFLNNITLKSNSSAPFG